MSLAHKTAIRRRAPSAPMKEHERSGRLVGRVLDYGSGRGFDADYFSIERYDPHYSPDMPGGMFDTIVCNFVLNVIESEEERDAVVTDIRSMLVPGGRAYFAVRTDKANLRGTTKIGTWQGRVVLDLPVVARGSGFETYELCA